MAMAKPKPTPDETGHETPPADVPPPAPMPPIPTWIMTSPGIDPEIIARLWANTTDAHRAMCMEHNVPPSVVHHGYVAPFTGGDRPIPFSTRVGRYDNRGIMESQNRLYDANAVGFRVVTVDGTIEIRRLTDYQMCIAWCMNHPKSKCDFMLHPDYIASTRTAYANGKHNDPTGFVSTHEHIRKSWGIDGVTPVSRPVDGPTKPPVPKPPVPPPADESATS